MTENNYKFPTVDELQNLIKNKRTFFEKKKNGEIVEEKLEITEKIVETARKGCNSLRFDIKFKENIDELRNKGYNVFLSQNCEGNFYNTIKWAKKSSVPKKFIRISNTSLLHLDEIICMTFMMREIEIRYLIDDKYETQVCESTEKHYQDLLNLYNNFDDMFFLCRNWVKIAYSLININYIRRAYTRPCGQCYDLFITINITNKYSQSDIFIATKDKSTIDKYMDKLTDS